MKLKHRLSVVLLCCFMGQSAVAGDEALWEQNDKRSHFFVSAGISMAVTAYANGKGYNKTESFLIGVGTTTLIGLAKEGIDGYAGTGTREVDDMTANILGAVTGSLLSMQFEWKF